MAGAALLLLTTACRVAELDREPVEQRPECGAVVAEHPLAADAGVAILEAGGNAADAAVAAALALAVVYPQAGNLGGGGFALWVPHVGEANTLDFREEAPGQMHAQLFLEDGKPVASRSLTTPLAVGVPGSPAGLWELYRRHGSKRFTFRQLAARAIELAREGFVVDSWLVRDLARHRSKLELDPGSKALFFPGGEMLREGERFAQPELAQTLERYARRGPSSFYEGEVARALVSTLEQSAERQGISGGYIRFEDLSAYEVVARPPLEGWFRGDQVIGMGPPSSGGFVILTVLSILDGYALDAERSRALDASSRGLPDGGDPAGVSAQALHWWIEAIRLAFADRAVHLGDPDHYPVPVDQLLDPRWINQRRVAIGERAAPHVRAWAPDPPPESDETTHLSVLDQRGNAVSLTTTLNGTFGSGILVPDAGFLLNNEVDDFSIQQGVQNMYGLVGREANQLRPGRRPLSSMSPTVVRAGGKRNVLVLGSPGGPRIITAVLQVLLRVLVYQQSLEAAVAAPRLHQQWLPIETRFEGGWDPSLLDRVRYRHAHPMKDPEVNGRFGSVQAIRVERDGSVEVASDPRRGGVGRRTGP